MTAMGATTEATSLVANTAEEKRTPPAASISYLPSFSGDGYGYGGGIVLTFGEIAIQVGEDVRGGPRHELARRIADACNSFDALTEANARMREALRNASDALGEIVQAHGAFCEQHVGVSQHSHDLFNIAAPAYSNAEAALKSTGAK
jgi:hypothetical protein